MKPVRSADGTRLYHVDRALAFIQIFDVGLVWFAESEARGHRKELRRNLAIVRRRLNASDPVGKLRIGAPNHFYDNEAREVVTWLPYCGSVRSVQVRLRRLFMKRYTCPIPNRTFATLAKALLEARVGVTIDGA